MTRIEALTQLAEKVMGATIRRRSEGRVIVADFPDGSHYYIQHHEAGPQILTQWNPFTNPAQALDLAEVWRASGDTDRRWKVNSPTTGNRFIAILDVLDKLPPNDGAVVLDCSPAAALTGAVCEAMGIEVTNAQ